MNKKHQVLILNLVLLFKFGISIGENRKSYCALGGGSPEETIQMEEAQPRIVGGYEVQDLSKFGYHAQYGTQCGAVIIGQYWVISAAHCRDQGYVRVGSKLVNQGTKYKVAKWFFHPNASLYPKYRRSDPRNSDIVLLQLEKPLTFSNIVYAIKIGKAEQLTVGFMLTVSGWGYERTNAKGKSNVLRAVDLPVVAQSVCYKSLASYKGPLVDNLLCAGFKQGGKDTCTADSGGPAVNNKRLFGIVTFGNTRCGLPDKYAGFLRIPIVVPWIQQVTKLTVT